MCLWLGAGKWASVEEIGGVRVKKKKPQQCLIKLNSMAALQLSNSSGYLPKRNEASVPQKTGRRIFRAADLS